jgi:hypothetical protein
MVLNLYIQNSSLFIPIRLWRKNMGKPSSSIMAKAIIINNGDKQIKIITLKSLLMVKKYSSV